KLQRMLCKTLGFSILYRVTGEGLQDQIYSAGGPFWTVEQCVGLIKGWFKAYQEIKDWMDQQDSMARRFGLGHCMWGRPRPIPEGGSCMPRVHEEGLRKGGNMPVQAGAQGVIKAAMHPDVLGRVYDKYRQYGVCEPLMQIHDELLSEVGVDMAEDFAEECKEV